MAEYKITVNFNDSGGTQNSYQSSFSAPIENGGMLGQSTDGEVASTIFSFVPKSFGKTFAKLGTVAGLASIATSVFSQAVARVDKYFGSSQAGRAAQMFGTYLKAVLNPIGTAIQTSFENEDSHYARKWENIEIQLLKERGGPNLNRSRTGM